MKNKIIQLNFLPCIGIPISLTFKNYTGKRNISISYTSVYRILTSAGIKSKKKHKERKIHRDVKEKNLKAI